MKIKIFILISIFFISCSSSQELLKIRDNILGEYVETRLLKEKKSNLYISEKTIQNIFIVDALESAQWQSSRDSITRKNMHKIKDETAKHFMNQENMNFYYSQLSFHHKHEKKDLDSKKVILINWERDKKDEELIRKAFGYTKSISKPLVSLDGNFALILERSNRNGCIIFIYKKTDSKWVEYDSITTCLI